VTQSLTLKARAFKSGMADSVVATEVYTLNAALPHSTAQGTYSPIRTSRFPRRLWVTIRSPRMADRPETRYLQRSVAVTQTTT
jgi:hypothetical protein